MNVAERYLVLGLRLGKHVDGLVDSYCGPPELQQQVDGEEPIDAAQLAADADALLTDVEDGWLYDQVQACATYAHVLAGKQMSYADEVERCYGVRPSLTPESVYEEAHAELDELLPGEGSLYERRQAWKERHLVDGTTAVAIVEDLLPILRERTNALVELPAGETLTIDPVRDEPWWAFNYYQGSLTSKVVLNTDVPTTGFDLIHLAAHEVYPGHHTEHALKEQLLIRDRGFIEEGLQLVPTPQAVLSEGIAEAGVDVILDDEAKEQLYAVIRGHGATLVDPRLSERIARTGEKLRSTGLNAALMIHDGGASVEEAEAYVQKWNLATQDQAKQSVRFVTDPTWRAYVITYTAGRELCSRYIGGDPARLRTLLTEPVRIGELLSA